MPENVTLMIDGQFISALNGVAASFLRTWMVPKTIRLVGFTLSQTTSPQALLSACA